MRTRARTATAASSRTMTLRLNSATHRRLERLAQATDRSKSWLAAQAVRTFLDINEWQVGAIRVAVRRANSRAARFVSNDEVDAWLATWGASEERESPL